MERSSAEGVYAGVPAADRRAARRERLLEAGLEIAGTRGWEAASVRAICAEAGLTSRYFYESFEGREQLLLAVFDRFAEESARRVLEAVTAAPDEVQAKSRAAITAFVEMLEEDPRKARVAFQEARGSEELMRRRLATLRLFARMIAEQALSFYGGERDRIVDTTAFLLAGGLAELLIAWQDGDLEIGRDELIDDCTELFAATGEASVAIARRRRAGR